MRKFFLSFIVVGLLSALVSCSTTHQLTLSAMEPAPVDLSHNIKRIGIINRSIPSEGKVYQDGIDQIVSTEDQLLATEGTNAAIAGLFDELLKDKRFDTIRILGSVPEVIKGIDVLPTTISWATIESICETYGVDAIFSLAFYDTDTRVSLKKSSVEQLDLMRVKVKVPGHEITLETLIENGWRIYDPYNKQVIDELIFKDQIVSTAKGVNPVEALEAIEDRKEAVLQQSMYTGSVYGLRLLPYERSISRDYYISGTDNFVIAKSLAQTGDWQGASELWEKEALSPKPKIRARACHNIAVIHEVNGDLEKAKEWASKSYADHKNKNALQYMEALDLRIAQNDLLQQQLSFSASSK